MSSARCLKTDSGSAPGVSGDCARVELLIAAGCGLPLSPEELQFMPGHLARCPACRQSALEPPPADVIGPQVVPSDAYSLGAEIGRGGMGRVLCARDRRIGRAVAIKEMLDRDPVATARFEREARITGRLQHRAIVAIYEVGRWPDGRPFYVMPILPGRTLAAALNAAGGTSDRLRLLPTIIAAAEAIAHAHSRRVVHRDLSPSNILLGDFGETTVIDWGLAKDLDEGADETSDGLSNWQTRPGCFTSTGAVIGTPGYMSPEQAEGRAADERSDIYSLGVILHQTLTAGLSSGRTGDIPIDLLSVARKAMASRAVDRYPNVAELVEDLRRHQAGQCVRAHSYTRRQRMGRWLSRRLTLVATASAMFTLLVATAFVGSVRVLRERRRADVKTQELQTVRQQLNRETEVRGYRERSPIASWIAAGSRPQDYQMRVDRVVTFRGRLSALLKSRDDQAKGFGTLMQTFSAEASRGKRLRFAARVRSDRVKGWAGLWMRVDGRGPGHLLAFDNMEDRAIRGSVGWTRQQVVLDVPPEAAAISVGVLLAGSGRVWIADVAVEVVDSAVPVTDGHADLQKQPATLNLAAKPGPHGVPPGWKSFGTESGDHLVSVERSAGAQAVSVRATRPDVQGASGIRQTVLADDFLGRRVRLSALARTREVKNGAVFWLSIDGRSFALSHDGMSDRPIMGTTDWRRYDIVLDVPADAIKLTFGARLTGPGELLVRDLTVDEADGKVPVTGGLAPAPRNLNFSG